MYETRATLTEIEMRGVPGAGAVLSGYPAVFNSVTDIGWFREQVAPKAFRKTLKERDIRALGQHDPGQVVGRSKVGPKNLTLHEDDHGLYHELVVPDTDRARALYRDIELGLIDGMSFAFDVIKEEWDLEDTNSPLRTLRELRLYEVSYVTFPAYEDSTVEARALQSIATATDIPLDDLINAAKAGELSRMWTPRATQEPQPSPVEDHEDALEEPDRREWAKHDLALRLALLP